MTKIKIENTTYNLCKWFWSTVYNRIHIYNLLTDGDERENITYVDFSQTKGFYPVSYNYPKQDGE